MEENKILNVIRHINLILIMILIIIIIQINSLISEPMPSVAEIKPVETKIVWSNGKKIDDYFVINRNNEIVVKLAKKKVIKKRKKTFKARVSQYSYADSCHNIKNGFCIMASGRPVYEGAVACPRWLKLGTKVRVDGKIYTCEDRYAKWVDTKFGIPTIDIFVESNPKGIKTMNIEIL